MHEYVLPVRLIFYAMNKKTRSLTLSALFSALTVISLFIASVWPTGQLGLAAFSSLFAAAAIIESGLGAGVYVFICSALLSMLLLSNRTAPLLYTLFFGYYPVLKSLIERIAAVPLQWALKLAVFNAALIAIYFLLRELFFDFGGYKPGLIIYCLAGSAVFALFDYGFSKVITLYDTRVHNRR